MARELQPCGTEAAYRRHRRRDETPCEKCLAAHREEKSNRVAECRAEAVEAAQAARPAVSGFNQLEILEEVLSNLRGQLVEAPPQSVAGIAKQIRETAAELAKIKGESSPQAQQSTGGGVDDIATRRAAREARRSAAAQG